jgi:hypothetical protein
VRQAERGPNCQPPTGTTRARWNSQERGTTKTTADDEGCDRDDGEPTRGATGAMANRRGAQPRRWRTGEGRDRGDGEHERKQGWAELRECSLSSRIRPLNGRRRRHCHKRQSGRAPEPFCRLTESSRTARLCHRNEEPGPSVATEGYRQCSVCEEAVPIRSRGLSWTHRFSAIAAEWQGSEPGQIHGGTINARVFPS